MAEIVSTEQTRTVFKPTEPQWRFLEAMVNPEVKPSVSSWTDAAGVGRTTYYDWVKDPAFLEWLQAESERMHRSAISAVHASMFRTAMQDSTPAHKLFLERFDKGYMQKDDQVGATQININLNQGVQVALGDGNDLLARVANMRKQAPIIEPIAEQTETNGNGKHE